MNRPHWLTSIALFLPLVSAVQAAELATVTMPERHRAFFKNYCVDCHNSETKDGNLQLDDIAFSLDTVEKAERWQKILNQLNSGSMPPKDAKRPDNREKTEFLDDLAHSLAKARKSLSDVGGVITMRRLNRREYKNSIRDLLGIELDVSDLPDDRGVGGFDTVGASLFMSSDQFEQYHALGRRALNEAFARSSLSTDIHARQRQSEHRETEELAKRVVRGTYSGYYLGGFKQGLAWRNSDRSKPPSEFGLTDEVEVDYRIQAFEKYGPSYAAYLSNPLSDTGSLLTSYSVADEVIALPPDTPSDWDKTVRKPVPTGTYRLKMRIGAISPKSGKRHFVEMGTRTSNVEFAFLRSFEITGTVAQPQILEITVSVAADGPRSFVFREKRARLPDDEIFLNAIKQNGVIPDPELWIDWVEWDGPLPTPAGEDAMFRIVGAEANETTESARKIIERFTSLAFRGQEPEADFIDRLVRLFESSRQTGRSFEESLKVSLSTVLASPGFLYLSEAHSQSERRELTLMELASRLSYFLWSAPPDNELLTLARNGDLRNPDRLSQQVNRMIASEKSRDFVTGFTHQWLGMDRLDFFQFNTKLYPRFDESTKAAAKAEVFATVEHLLRNKGSLSSLLKSDFIVTNGLLANYYEIEGVTGDHFRPVSLSASSPRGGLLGMAAILAIGSNGETTSPVERGAWVLRKLLNDAPPPAPPNVPQISRLEGQLLTTRERLAAHQEEAQCASCHRKIDPIGFGLENFNAVGSWRTEDRYVKPGIGNKEWTIDPAGAFHNGPSFKSYFELRDLIAAREDDFAHGFSEALIEYALGRPYSFSDEDLAMRLVARAKTQNFSMQEFFQALVASPEFHR
ncbi:DUF1592 domain-containing protein [Schlesneria paludicola]|uniref:DUF1592 domain-containing protein n=1 Tax=Schlesneria paludicola TaxID=360056 RepID=UPI00029B0057|nr:DUF1592 domain-containing protein [Schlesneria paludicola]